MTNRSDEGFSLIEVLIASMILSTALGALALLMPRALDATRVAGDRFTATTLARDRLEELSSLPGGPALASGEDIVATRAGAFVRRWQVSIVAGEPGLAAIRVVVRRRSDPTGFDGASLATISVAGR